MMWILTAGELLEEDEYFLTWAPQTSTSKRSDYSSIAFGFNSSSKFSSKLGFR
jgi:hypothetical protein